MTHILIPDTDPEMSYAVGGSATSVFAVPFPFFSLTDIVVVIDAERLTYGVDYTVSGTAGYTSGYPSGSVTLTSAVTNTTVWLFRELVVARTSDFPPSGPFQIEVLNTDLDRLTAYVQELGSRALQRTLDSQAWDAGGYRIINVGTPVDGTDAATKDYVESLLEADTGYLVSNEFTGDGATVAFTLSVPVLGGAPAVLVALDGAAQTPSAYSLSGTTLTFDSAPPLGCVIDVRVIGTAAGVIAATTLDTLVDVNAPAPTDGQVLTFDSGAGEWVAETPAAVDLSGYATTAALTTGLATKAAASHSHAVADVTGLQAALDAKAPLASPVFSGSVGVGVTPTTVFQVGDATNRLGAEPRSDGGALGGIPSANLARVGGWYSTNPIPGAAVHFAAQGGAGQRGAIAFLTKALDDDTTQPTVRAVVTQDGKLGVGTTDPSEALHLVGNLLVTGTITGTQPYDLSVTVTGTPSNSEILLRFVAVRAISFAANFASSQAKAGTAATGSTVFDLAKNGSGIGTITFAAAGTSGTWASSGGGAQSLAAGDVLTLTGPATADATLADIGFTLAGTRS